MGFFSDLFGTSGAATDAANAKSRGLNLAYQSADPLYAQGREAISSGYGQAQNLFAPIVGQAQAGASAYGDITGAAGQAGQDRARALFQTDPGYEFARDQALQATQRLQGSGGFQGSGNVATALEDRASGLAQQQYGNYVQRLAPFLGYSLGATTAAAPQYTGEGNALAANYTGLGGLGYQTQAGIGSANAAGILGEAQANQQALDLAGKLLGYGLGAASGNPAAFAKLGNQFFGGGSPSGYGT